MPSNDDLSNWLTKAEACQRLSISERTLDTWVTAGKIERQSRPTPGRRPLPVHRPEDIEKLEARTPVVISQREAETREIAARPAARSADGEIAALFQILRSAAVPPPPRLWMTIEEASAYSGLSKAGLRRFVRDGGLPGLRDGSLKVRKADLDSFAAGEMAAAKSAGR